MEIKGYFSQDNITLIIAVGGFALAALNYVIARKKAEADKLIFLRDLHLAAEKLRPVLATMRKLTNIDPNHLTLNNFEQDREIWEEAQSKYLISESLIVAISYQIPGQISTIDAFFEKLGELYSEDGIDELILDRKVIRAYGQIFLFLTLLSRALDYFSEMRTTLGDKESLSDYFSNLYMTFFAHKDKLTQANDAKFRNALENLMKSLEPTREADE